MRKILMLAVTLNFCAGCATAIPYSYEQQCAARGMKLAGVTSGTTGGSLTSYGWEDALHFQGTTESVSCKVPDSPADKCDVNHARAALEPIEDYNDSIGTKRFITGVGYVAAIVPGVVAKILYDSKARSAKETSRKIAAEASPCKE